MGAAQTPPPTGIPQILWEKVRDISKSVDRMKDTTIAHDRMLVEAFGQSGKNGTIGRLLEDVEKLETTIGMLNQKLDSLKKFQVKIILYALGGGGTGAGLVEIATRLLG